MTLAVEIPRERFVLACGAALLVSQRPAASVTAVRVHVRGGPSLDPPGKQGLAYLTGHLSDQGTADHTEEQIAELLEPAGGEISGDSNGLGGTIAGGSWELLVDLVGELLMRPTYPDEPVARQRTRLLSRLQVEREDPRVQGGRLFRKLVYGDHWLGRAAYGTFESVSTITPDDLRAHHRAAWVGNRCVIGVCGNVEPERVRERFEQALAGFAPGEPFVRETPLLPPLAPRAAAFAADRKQVHVYLGHLGIRRQDPDYATLVVMDHVLGTGPGFTNRITRRLREMLRDTAEGLRDLPMELRRLVRRLEHDDFTINFQHRGLEDMDTSVKSAANRLTIGVINYAAQLDGVQIGVINVASSNRPGWRVLPVANWRMQ